VGKGGQKSRLGKKNEVGTMYHQEKLGFGENKHKASYGKGEKTPQGLKGFNRVCVGGERGKLILTCEKPLSGTLHGTNKKGGKDN